MAKVEAGRGPFFAMIPFGLMRDERLNSTDIAVYAALRSFADFGKSTGARVSDPTAAKMARCSTRAFGMSRMRLQEAGWIDWIKENGRPNIYVIHNSLAGESTAESAVDENQTAPQNLRIPPQNLPITNNHYQDPTDKQISGAGAPAAKKRKKQAGEPAERTYVNVASDVWAAHFGTPAPPGGRIGNALKPLVKVHGEGKVLELWEKYVKSVKIGDTFKSPQDFASKFGAYLEADGGSLSRGEQQRGNANGTLSKPKYEEASKPGEVRFKR